MTARRPRLLDLYCGPGGASAGYAAAGFDVVGIDIEPQPNYPFTFIQADALHPPVDLADFDLIHASPPCQIHSSLRLMNADTDYADRHLNLIPATRELLEAGGRPYVIENVAGARAELHSPILLCGSMFGLQVRRHRLFELGGWYALAPTCDHKTQGQVLGVYGHLTLNRRRVKAVGNGGGIKAAKGEAASLLGIEHHVEPEEAVLAIPPAYTRWIGEQALNLKGVLKGAGS